MARRATTEPQTPVRNRIRELRFHAGEMTQQELAKRIGMTRQTVNAIEGGKYAPSLEAAFRIARVFDATVDDVFSFDDSVPSSTS